MCGSWMGALRGSRRQRELREYPLSMGDAASTPEAGITISAGRASEVTSDERRAALEQLAQNLRKLGADAKLEITEYVPGRRGIVSAEQVAIFIGTAAGSGLVGAVVTDIYTTAKDWARRRFKTKKNGRPEYVVVKDNQGRTMTFRISKEGESEEVS